MGIEQPISTIDHSLWEARKSLTQFGVTKAPFTHIPFRSGSIRDVQWYIGVGHLLLPRKEWSSFIDWYTNLQAVDPYTVIVKEIYEELPQVYIAHGNIFVKSGLEIVDLA